MSSVNEDNSGSKKNALAAACPTGFA